jgi:RNA-binding protein 8A
MSWRKNNNGGGRNHTISNANGGNSNINNNHLPHSNEAPDGRSQLNNANDSFNNSSLPTPEQQQQRTSISQRSSGPQKSVEGWILFVTGVHQELEEDDLTDLFSDFGVVQQICVNQDRQTGGNKGYALVEYGAYTEAQDAINALHGSVRNGNEVMGVDWAFVKPTGGGNGRNGGGRRGGGSGR